MFGDKKNDIASSVIIPLHGFRWTGVLAIGSFDADPKDTDPENIVSGHVSMLVEMNGTSDFLIVKVGCTTSGTARHLGNGTFPRCTFAAHKLII